MTRLAKTIMVQGAASNVGKSVIATALCRILKRRGFRVAPFKAQNMANNSSVTSEGGEIGTAQAVQAHACGLKPSMWMNPILLKPNSDTTSQVIVLGKVRGTLTAKEYQQKKLELVKYVKEALDKLRQEFDIVVIEGAGSPAEINLKQYDIVNMAVAKSVSAPVILVADIDRGGVFAQIIGTFDLLDEQEKELLKAFIINKFRGDKDILMPGIKWIEEKMNRRSLGVIPMIPGLKIKQEDAVVLDDYKDSVHQCSKTNQENLQKLLIQVVRLPRISNFTDFEPLGREEDVILEYINYPNRHRLPDLLIIPGTKNTVADLEFLKKSSFVNHIHRCRQVGVNVLGICGGYQMLGMRIEDHAQVESGRASIEGIGLLPTVTTFYPNKTTVQVKALHPESQCQLEGYEIHMGQTRSLNGKAPFFKIIQRQGESCEEEEGYFASYKAAAGQSSFVAGTYIHGLFDLSPFRRYFLNHLRHLTGLAMVNTNRTKLVTGVVEDYDRLADEVEKNIDLKFLGELLGEQLV